MDLHKVSILENPKDFVPVPYCLDDCNFVVKSGVRKVDSSSSIFFFFSRLFWVFEVFCVLHTSCEIICSSSVKNTIGSLIGIALNL